MLVNQILNTRSINVLLTSTFIFLLLSTTGLAQDQEWTTWW